MLTLLGKVFLIVPTIVSPFASIFAVILEIDASKEFSEFLLPTAFHAKKGIRILIPLVWRMIVLAWLEFQFLAAANFLLQFGTTVFKTMEKFILILGRVNSSCIRDPSDPEELLIAKLWPNTSVARARSLKIKFYRIYQIYWYYVDENFNELLGAHGLLFGGICEIIGNYFIVRFYGELPFLLYGPAVVLFILLGVEIFVALDVMRNPYRLSTVFLDELKARKPSKYVVKVLRSMRPLEVSIGVFTKVRRDTGLIMYKIIADFTFTALLTI